MSFYQELKCCELSVYNIGMILQFILGVPAEVCGFVFAFGEGEGTVVYTLIQVFNNLAGVSWMDI